MQEEVFSLKEKYKSLQTKELKGHKKNIKCVEFQKWEDQAHILATAGDDKVIKIWNLQNNVVAHELSGHEESIDQISFHPQNVNLLASVSQEDKTFRIWDLRTNSNIKKFEGSGNSKLGNMHVCWSPQGQYIALTNRENTLSLLDFNKDLKTVKSSKFPYEIIAKFDVTGRLLLLGNGNGNVDVLNFYAQNETSPYIGNKDGRIRTLKAHTGSITCLQVLPEHIVVGSTDGSCSIWRIPEFICTSTIQRFETAVVQARCNSQMVLAKSNERLPVLSASATVPTTPSNNTCIDFSWNGKSILEKRTNSPIHAMDWHSKDKYFAYADGKDVHLLFGL